MRRAAGSRPVFEAARSTDSARDGRDLRGWTVTPGPLGAADVRLGMGEQTSLRIADIDSPVERPSDASDLTLEHVGRSRVVVEEEAEALGHEATVAFPRRRRATLLVELSAALGHLRLAFRLAAHVLEMHHDGHDQELHETDRVDAKHHPRGRLHGVSSDRAPACSRRP
jgi:hypothetical protein